jgi:radical SAM superfamily enzyme YgiQ (UPF0313 family)
VLNKKFKAEQIRRAFSLTVSYGILARAYIIYGCPGESRDTVEDTIRLLTEIRPLVTIFHVLSLFPGTYLYDLFKSRTGATDDIWLSREEDLCFFEIDSNLSRETVLEIGRRLKKELQKAVPDFIRALELVDDEELYPCHAAFLSRLALTIDRGDYPHVLSADTSRALARELYRRALDFAPDAQAYWGLGLLARDENDYQQAEAILRRGREVFPQDELLSDLLAEVLVHRGTDNTGQRRG